MCYGWAISITLVYIYVGLKIQHCCLKWWKVYSTEIFQQKREKISMVHYHNLSWYGTTVYHGLPVSIYRGSTMVYHAFYHGLPVSKYHGKPWYAMHFTMVYQFQNTMVYHAFYHGLPVSKYHGKPWYTMHFTMVYQFQNTMVYRGIPCILPWFTSFKIPWYTVVYHAFYHGLPVSKYHGRPWYAMGFTMVYQFQNTMVQFTMVQIYHGTIVPWYNVAWYTMVLFHKGYKEYAWNTSCPRFQIKKNDQFLIKRLLSLIIVYTRWMNYLQFCCFFSSQ